MPGSPEGGSFSNPEVRGEILGGSLDEVTVRVDEDYCVGHGRCEQLAPGVFYVDRENGNIARVIAEELTDDLMTQAQQAEAGCPAEAIIIE